MQNKLLEIKNLTKTYKLKKGLKSSNLTVLKDIDFFLSKGENLGIIGESGSGKSTLARIIAGLEQPDKGEIFWEGQKLSFPRKPNPFHIQMVFQDPFASLNPKQKIKTILQEPLIINTSLNKKQRLTKIVSWLEALNLSSSVLERYPHQFSGGQRQRIALARAFLLEPKLIILDEPVSALDVSVQAQILSLLKKLQKEKQLSYFFISHDLAVVRYLCEDILVIFKGLLVEKGKVETILKNTAHPYTLSLIQASLGQKTEFTFSSNLKGCPFVNSCPKQIALCLTTFPTWQKVSSNQQVLCHVPKKL